MTQPEIKLAKRFNRGDIHALRDIYDLYKHDCLTLAMALLHDSASAEDIVHDVFARLADSGRPIRILGSLRGYLLTAVANRARRHLRRKDRQPLEPTGTQGYIPPPEQLTILDEQQQRLSKALKQLPFEQREVLVCRYFGGLKLKAIAKSQNVSINTIQGRTRYGLEKLRSLLGGDL